MNLRFYKPSLFRRYFADLKEILLLGLESLVEDFISRCEGLFYVEEKL